MIFNVRGDPLILVGEGGVYFFGGVGGSRRRGVNFFKL